MKGYIIIDEYAGERNSHGFLVFKDSAGEIHFCYLEFGTKTNSLAAALDWGHSTPNDWSEWTQEDNLIEAAKEDIADNVFIKVTAYIDTSKETIFSIS